jgi:hypothetical protein
MTKPKQLPDYEYLRECFDYDPDTGTLTWKDRPIDHFRDETQYKYWFTSKESKDCADYIHNTGYRKVSLDQSQFYSHRVIYKLMTTSDPGSMDINHINHDRGDNRWVNLELTDRSGNMRSAFEFYGTSHKGSDHPYSKLTESDVLEIHDLLRFTKFTQKEISEFYNVTRVTISAISTGRNWSWLHPSNI